MRYNGGGGSAGEWTHTHTRTRTRTHVHTQTQTVRARFIHVCLSFAHTSWTFSPPGEKRFQVKCWWWLTTHTEVLLYRWLNRMCYANGWTNKRKMFWQDHLVVWFVALPPSRSKLTLFISQHDCFWKTHGIDCRAALGEVWATVMTKNLPSFLISNLRTSTS